MVRKHSRSAPLICTIDLNGFGVVMVTFAFVLLASMMVWPRDEGSWSVDLPKVHHAVAMPRAYRDDAIVLAIARDGKVYFGADAVRPEQFPALIRDRLTAGAERKIYLKVDRGAKYGVVALVLDEVRSAGVEDIAFLVENVRATQALGK